MKHSAINPNAVKEIIPDNKTYMGTKSFCSLPPITPMQLVEVVAFLINDVISGAKNRLLNFIGRSKIYGKTTIIDTEETVKPIAGKVLDRMLTASELSAAVKSSGIAGAVVGSAEEAAAVMKHSAINPNAVKEIIPDNKTYTSMKNQLLNFIGMLKIK